MFIWGCILPQRSSHQFGEDKRATLVTFTALGWQFLQDAYQVKQAIEADYIQVLGEQGMAQLQAFLERLLERGA